MCRDSQTSAPCSALFGLAGVLKAALPLGPLGLLSWVGPSHPLPMGFWEEFCTLEAHMTYGLSHLNLAVPHLTREVAPGTLAALGNSFLGLGVSSPLPKLSIVCEHHGSSGGLLHLLRLSLLACLLRASTIELVQESLALLAVFRLCSCARLASSSKI